MEHPFVAATSSHDASVFISFCSKDMEIAQKVWHELQSREIRCWISCRHIGPGEDFQQSIVTAMERAKVCVLVFSRHADQSAEVKKELAIANHIGLAIMPARIEDIEPSGAMRYQLTNRQFVDLFDDWHEGVGRLAEAVRSHVRAHEHHIGLSDAETDRSGFIRFSEAELSQTTDRLTLFLGPIASILVKQAAAQAASLADLHMLLAEQIANDRERLSFLEDQPSTTMAATTRPRRLLIGLAVATAVAALLAWPLLDGAGRRPPDMQAATSRAPRALVAHPAVAPAAKAPIEPVIDARKEPLPSPAHGLLPIPKARGGPSEAQSDPLSMAEVGPLRPSGPAPAPQVETAPLLLPELGMQSPHEPAPAAVALSPAANAPPVPAAAPQHLRDCEECPEMMLVGAGDFLMGAVPDDPLAEAEEKPQRKVVIAAPFYIGIYEVSFDEWRACLAAGGCRGHKPADAGWGTGKRPVINVSFLDAEAYAGWLSQKTQHRYRLPSEEEWEYTARGGTIPQVPAGDSNRRDANCNGCDSKWGNRQTAPVGSFQANALGLYDMPGNVWEWTTGCWQRDEAGAVPASEGRTASLGRCDERVLRGGSWANSPAMLRSSARIWGSPDGRNNNVGFRVVREHDNRF